MESAKKLTVACDDYEIVQPLWDGRVTAEGLQLVPQPDVTIAQRQGRMIHDAAFDVCELSATTYFLARDRGLPLAALPIFLLRKFRHGDIFINTSAGIRQPSDLIGKKIGGICYQVASNVWARGILAEYYGVPHDSVTWVVERDEEISFPVPAGLRIERLSNGASLEAALLSGAIDALMAPVVPNSIHAGDSRIARLFPDHKDVERAYFAKTGIFPIMHVLTARRELLERHPWIAARLCTAFQQAKELAYKRVGGARAVPLAWFGTAWEEERRIFGPDPWPYGMGKINTVNLETILRYMREQGMIHSATGVAEMFVTPAA